MIDLATKWYGCRPDQLASKFDADQNGRSFKDQLTGRKVKNHLNYTKKIEGFGPSAIKHTFLANNVKTTIIDYFANQGIKLK